MTTDDPTEPYRNQIVRFAEEVKRLTEEAKAKDEAHAAEVARLRDIASAGITPELFVRDAFIDHILTGRRTPAERLVSETVTVGAREYDDLVEEVRLLRIRTHTTGQMIVALRASLGIPKNGGPGRAKVADLDLPEQVKWFLGKANREAKERRLQVQEMQKRLREVEAERDRAIAMVVGPAADALTQQRLQRTARSAASSPQPTRNRGRDSFRPVAGAS